MALYAFDDELAGERRAAAAILDHVTERADRCRFADDAVVDRLTALAQRIGDGDRSVNGVDPK